MDPCFIGTALAKAEYDRSDQDASTNHVASLLAGLSQLGSVVKGQTYGFALDCSWCQVSPSAGDHTRGRMCKTYTKHLVSSLILLPGSRGFGDRLCSVDKNQMPRDGTHIRGTALRR